MLETVNKTLVLSFFGKKFGSIGSLEPVSTA